MRISSGPDLSVGGHEVFDAPAALQINAARLSHLDSLGFDWHGKRVLDVGAGVGHLARFFLERMSKVVCVEGRMENIERGRTLYPDLEFHLGDVEQDSLRLLGEFDVVFCYGLLYHLENPLRGLRNLASACREVLLIETLVCDHDLPLNILADEPVRNVNQALRGFGSRPTPAFIVMALSRLGFPWIYQTSTVPDFSDFHFEEKNNLDIARDGHNLRRIFVASRHELENDQLLQLSI